MTLCGQTNTQVPHSQQLPYATTSFIICLKVTCAIERESIGAAFVESTLERLSREVGGAGVAGTGPLSAPLNLNRCAPMAPDRAARARDPDASHLALHDSPMSTNAAPLRVASAFGDRTCRRADVAAGDLADGEAALAAAHDQRAFALGGTRDPIGDAER